MVVSHSLRYVYIGIPRTGSKSMIQWLTKNYQGEHILFHHSWEVPNEAKDYLVFTTVRNPYDRWTSGTFSLPWGREIPSEKLREYNPCDRIDPEESLEEQIKERTLQKDGTLKGVGNVPENSMNQWFYCQRSGVSQVLFFERLTECLRDLPFVPDHGDLPEFPHALERGIRPPGGFYDHFDEDAEKVVWAYESEVFDGFGYQRHREGLPEDSPNSLMI